MIYIYTHTYTLLRKSTRDAQEIARVKYEIWLQGGPYTDFQQLFVTGSSDPLGDIEKLEDVLPRGATLQLVITAPAARELSVHAFVGPDYPCAADEFTVPIASHAFETPTYYVTADILYLGDVTVESSAVGSSIALEIQKQFGEMRFDPQMVVFVSVDDHRGRCAQGEKIRWNQCDYITPSAQRNFPRCVDWSRGVVPLCADTTALALQNLHLLLIPEDAVCSMSDED